MKLTEGRLNRIRTEENVLDAAIFGAKNRERNKKTREKPRAAGSWAPNEKSLFASEVLYI